MPIMPDEIVVILAVEEEGNAIDKAIDIMYQENSKIKYEEYSIDYLSQGKSGSGKSGNNFTSWPKCRLRINIFIEALADIILRVPTSEYATNLAYGLVIVLLDSV